ncbi:MAG: helix-turn-helix domain-containing protein [Kiritimatiellia bacterium]|jgi:cytoskeleton protein RodZ
MALGEILRKAREERGMTPADVAGATHLLTRQIEALEREDFSGISAAIYGRGFVKLYAECVGLDPKPLCDEFMSIYTGARSPKVGRRPGPQVQPAPAPAPEAVPEPAAPAAAPAAAPEETEPGEASGEAPALSDSEASLGTLFQNAAARRSGPSEPPAPREPRFQAPPTQDPPRQAPRFRPSPATAKPRPSPAPAPRPPDRPEPAPAETEKPKRDARRPLLQDPRLKIAAIAAAVLLVAGGLVSILASLRKDKPAHVSGRPEETALPVPVETVATPQGQPGGAIPESLDVHVARPPEPYMD